MKKVWKDCDKELPVDKVVQVLLGSGKVVVAKYLEDERLWVDSKNTIIDPVAYRA